MVDLKSFSATKFGVLVTSIVILGACSHQVIQQDADTQIPQSAFSAPTPEPESASQPAPEQKYKQTTNLWKKHKRKTRIAKNKKAKRPAHVVAKHSMKKKHKAAAAAIAQVRDNGNSNGPGMTPPPPPAPEMAQMAAPVPPAPAPAGFGWITWLLLAAALGMGYAGFRYYRGPKRSRRRLVFN